MNAKIKPVSEVFLFAPIKCPICHNGRVEENINGYFRCFGDLSGKGESVVNPCQITPEMMKPIFNEIKRRHGAK
jgi:hypothetical protein